MSINTPTMHRLLPLLILSLGLAFSPACFGQKAKYKIADEYFRTFDFTRAAKVYEDILEKHPADTLALRRAADCYRNLGKPAAAEAKFKALSQLPERKADDLLAYAEALRMNQKYAESILVYEQFAQLHPENPIALQYLEDPLVFTKMLRDSTRYSIKLAGINSTESDFGLSIIDSANVMFASARAEGKGKSRIYNWNNQSYLNIYSAQLRSDSTLDAAKVQGGKLNTRFHEGAVAFDAATKQLYLTRNNTKGSSSRPDEDGVLRLAIYTLNKTESGYEELLPFAYNSENYSVGHPSISPDGKRIYFSSDMPGGFGGADIWYCDRDSSGNWALPVNMGFKVNSAGNELFPFIMENRLFFSSNGQPGLGGQDIFYANLDGPSVLQVINLGYPVNSSSDDFSIALFKGAKRGFFASNRTGGMGDDDIYELTITPPSRIVITGKVVDDSTGEPLEGATIVLQELMGVEQEDILGSSETDGSFKAEVPFASELTLRAIKQLYFPTDLKLEPDALSGYMDNVEIRLKRFDYAVEGKVLLAETNKPTAGATVKLMDGDGKVLEEQVTAADGRYFFILEEGNEYEVEASFPDYLTLSENVSTINKPKGITYIDFTLFKPEKGVVVKLNNIYYDYNKADIRPDAAKELDRLVKILEDNPSMKIELGSHSDSRGSDSYNLSLSQKRAKSAVDYLISQGINSKRLISKGYGETQLKNRCKNDVNCSDEEHEENRRTEFKILDI